MQQIPQMNLEQLREIIKPDTEGELGIPSVEIIDSKGAHLGTLVIPQRIGGGFVYDEIYNHAEMLAVRANTVLPHAEVLDFENRMKVERSVREKVVFFKPKVEGGVISKDIVCSYCGEPAKSVAGLKSHVRNKHKEVEHAPV